MPDRYALGHYDDRDLDQQIDRALASYADQEPDPALRTRILARVADAAPRTRRLWLLALAACTVLAVMFVYFGVTPVPRRNEAGVRAMPTSTSAPDPSGAVRRSSRTEQTSIDRPIHPVHRVVRKPLLTLVRKRPGITAGTNTLTAQERLLLQFAAEHPEQARDALKDSPRSVAPEPLTIAPIQIAAISISQSDVR
jgi:hypothetical protein